MTQLTAHRGGARLGPENSLTALRRSTALGIPCAEIDVQLTADGALVLIHDEALTRNFGSEKRVSDCTLEELRELRSREREPIATLEEAIAVVRGRTRLNIELKEYGRSALLPEAVVALLRGKDFLGGALLCSFSAELMRAAHALEPRLPVGYTFASRPATLPAPEEAAFVSVTHEAIDADLVREVHARRQELHAWTVNDRPTMLRLMALGVDHLITDDPVLGKEALAAFDRKGWVARRLLRYGR